MELYGTIPQQRHQRISFNTTMGTTVVVNILSNLFKSMIQIKRCFVLFRSLILGVIKGNVSKFISEKRQNVFHLASTYIFEIYALFLDRLRENINVLYIEYDRTEQSPTVHLMNNRLCINQKHIPFFLYTRIVLKEVLYVANKIENFSEIYRLIFLLNITFSGKKILKPEKSLF